MRWNIVSRLQFDGIKRSTARETKKTGADQNNQIISVKGRLSEKGSDSRPFYVDEGKCRIPVRSGLQKTYADFTFRR